MSERVIYQQGTINITSSKVSFGGTTFFLRNIASVSVVNVRRSGPLWSTVFGALILLISLPQPMQMIGGLVIGPVMIAGAILVGFTRCYLRFDTSSGSVNAIHGKEAEMLLLKSKIEEALAQAAVA